MAGRERVSFSRMQKYRRCGEAYRREVLEKEYPPPTSAMARGTALHYVASESHMRQLKARAANPTAPKTIVLRESLPSEEEAADLAASRFEQERKLGMPGKPQEIGHDKDVAVRMGRYYLTRVAPYLDPLYVERRVDIDPADQPVRITMVFDLGIRNSDGSETLYDTKTSEKEPDADVADAASNSRDAEQLTMYALGRKVETGVIPKVALNFIVSDSKRGVWQATRAATRDERDLRTIVHRLNNFIEAERAGVFVANGPGNWWCSAKWCRFHSTCRFVGND